jgi:hypothetical protein
MVVPGGSTQSFPPIPMPSPPPPVRGLVHPHSCLLVQAGFMITVLCDMVLVSWASVLAGQTQAHARVICSTLPSFARDTSTPALHQSVKADWRACEAAWNT